MVLKILWKKPIYPSLGEWINKLWNTLMMECESDSYSVVSDSLWPMDYILPGSSVQGILQARILEWVVIPFSRGSSQHSYRTRDSCIASRFFTIWAMRNVIHQLEAMHYQATKRHGGNSNAFLSAKEVTLKKLQYYLISIIWHAEKGKTIETVQRSVVARDLGGE